ncbi:MAG: spermidine/putrescine transport system substrate-binding protein [Thermotogaceae bacterium]|nr:spermidine/putrescine transport system substrate-binding protein [Thermotogaceae bacterium]MDN5337998.1 spermidine/putrescine transport system substrate-binding protein [Thermotogaceae bacterium]
MKKLLVFVMILVSVVAAFSAQKLYIYSWADYIPEEVIEKFEKLYDCKVIYDTYDSNETMYAKLKAGARGYDIAFPSGDYTQIMIREGMVLPLDKSKIPNFKNIDPEVLKKIDYDPGNKYSVPYQMGSTGIAVNTKYLKDYPKSWKIFEMPEIRGRATLLDDMREVFGAALKYLGYSVNTTNIEELKQAKEVILKWKENIAKFDNELFAKGIISGEFWVVHGYGENIFYEATEEEAENIDFFIPQEGGTLWIDNMVILKGAKNIDLAYKFINFILEPEIAAEISDYLLLPCIVVPARELLQEERIYTVEDLKNCEMIKDLGENLKLYNELWNEIRFGMW